MVEKLHKLYYSIALILFLSYLHSHLAWNLSFQFCYQIPQLVWLLVWEFPDYLVHISFAMKSDRPSRYSYLHDRVTHDRAWTIYQSSIDLKFPVEQ